MASSTGAAAPQKVIGPLDRVELNVGGVSFHSTVATLTAKSSYFASLLSGNYKDTAGDGATQVFLDQDPGSFRKLLALMREGMIDAAVLDRGVLLLAEYLQMEELLVAVKARSYKNLQPGSLKMDDNAAADEFDKKYGGIRNALARVDLLGSIKEQPKPKEKKKFAVLTIGSDLDYTEFRGNVMRERVDITKVNEEGVEDEILYENLRIVGALNWLYSNGYTEQLDVIDDNSTWTLSITFSGSMTEANEDNQNGNTSRVFTPEVDNFKNCSYTKEFAMIGSPASSDPERGIFVVTRDPSGNDPSMTIKISSPEQAWLGKNGYTTCETGLESLLKDFMKGNGNAYDVVGIDDGEDEWHPGVEKDRYPFKIYSRKRFPLDEKEYESDQEMM